MCCLYQAAATHWNFDEFWIKLGGQKPSDHVGDLGDEVRLERITGSDGFRRPAMGKAREDHGNGVVRRKGKIGNCDVGFELVNDGCEDRVREAIKGTPMGIAKRDFKGPDVFGGECSEG